MHKDTLREFAVYVSLSVAGMLGVSCYILADTFFISKGLGTEGLAALNLAIPVYNFIHGTGLMLGAGGGTKFSVCRAHGNRQEADRVYTDALRLTFLLSLPFFLTGLVWPDELALLLGADKSVLAMTATYLKWLLLFSPAFILNEVLLCFVRNDGAPRLSMAAMLTGSFANILLDYVFIFPMEMGMFGAVFATGLSPLISMVMMSPHWLRRKNGFRLVRAGMNIRMAGQILSLGLPSLIAQTASGLVMICFNGIMLGLEGNVGVAAYGVIANIALVVLAVYSGMGQGIQPLISSAYGQADRGRIKLLMKYSVSSVLAISFAVYAFLFIFAEPIVSVFNSEGDPALALTAARGLRLYFISAAFMGYNTVLSAYFSSVEDPVPAQILSILRGLVLILPLAYLLSAFWQTDGTWLACPISEAAAAALGLWIYKKSTSRQMENA